MTWIQIIDRGDRLMTEALMMAKKAEKEKLKLVEEFNHPYGNSKQIQMSILGSLGEIVFETVETGVKNEWQPVVRTFDDFSRSSSGRWAQHDVMGQKPKKQWLGPGLDSISLSIRFSVSLGMNPRKELDRISKLEQTGKALPLVIGGKGIGTGLWVITNVSQNWERIDNKGRLLDATATLSLEEYVK
ncbi:phage tail protein [Paenibacillus spiritus]|nr:phage tail protein [Paenibacillus spiritus]